jgi:hypothetical protein
MSRGCGYTIAKIYCLLEILEILEIIEDLLPIGPNDWDRVTQRHTAYYPGHVRTRETLKRKFASLYNHKKNPQVILLVPLTYETQGGGGNVRGVGGNVAPHNG